MNIIGSPFETAKGNQEVICPFLGLLDDPQTSLSYPSSWNACHRAKPVATPNLDHQQSYCLSGAYTNCPVFIHNKGASLPAEIQAPENGPFPRSRNVWLISIAFILLFGIIGGAWAFLDHRASVHASAGQATELVATELVATERVATNGFDFSLTPSMTPTSTFLFQGVTIIPTDTKTPQATTASVAKLTPKTELGAYCRFGPGSYYPLIIELKGGDTVPILGTNADHSWWQIDDPLAPGTKCWVSALVVDTSGDLSHVPIAPTSPLPSTDTPVVPTGGSVPPSHTPTPTPTPTPTSDTIPPVLTLPADIAVEATSGFGATVNFTVTASDAGDPSPAVTCSPDTGSTFPIGTTTVNCTATDASLNASHGSFTVTVRDTTAPVLSLPGNSSHEATSGSGANVIFTASASDAVDGSVPVSCSPVSGSTFSLGDTTVNCTATDSHGNPSNGSFTVTVVDTTPPTLSLPGDITVDAASGESSASVSFTASASDAVDGSVPVSCSPASGSTFSGTTTVNCSATDSHSNTSNGSFSVTVNPTP